MAVLEIFSIIASPIIGIVGGALQRKHERDIYREDTKRISAKYDHEEKVYAFEMERAALQGALDAQEGERDIALADMEGSLDVFKAGIKAESDLSKIVWGKSKLGDIANFMRAIIRPSITIYLTAIVSVYAGYSLLTVGLTDENRYLMLAMVSSFEMTLAFWFASRSGHNKSSFNDGTYSRN